METAMAIGDGQRCVRCFFILGQSAFAMAHLRSASCMASCEMRERPLLWRVLLTSR